MQSCSHSRTLAFAPPLSSDMSSVCCVLRTPWIVFRADVFLALSAAMVPVMEFWKRDRIDWSCNTHV